MINSSKKFILIPINTFKKVLCYILASQNNSNNIKIGNINIKVTTVERLNYHENKQGEEKWY